MCSLVLSHQPPRTSTLVTQTALRTDKNGKAPPVALCLQLLSSIAEGRPNDENRTKWLSSDTKDSMTVNFENKPFFASVSWYMWNAHRCEYSLQTRRL